MAEPAPRSFVLPVKYRWIGLVLVAVVAIGLFIAWPYFRPTSTPQDLATDACQAAVLDQTGDPGTARFEDVETSNLTQSILFLGLEQVTDVAVNGYVTHKEDVSNVSQHFLCRVHVEHGETSITTIDVN